MGYKTIVVRSFQKRDAKSNTHAKNQRYHMARTVFKCRFSRVVHLRKNTSNSYVYESSRCESLQDFNQQPYKLHLDVLPNRNNAVFHLLPQSTMTVLVHFPRPKPVVQDKTSPQLVHFNVLEFCKGLSCVKI